MAVAAWAMSVGLSFFPNRSVIFHPSLIQYTLGVKWDKIAFRMSLERWIEQNQKAVRALKEQTDKPTGGPNGYCEILFIATFSNKGTVPRDGWILAFQLLQEWMHGIDRRRLSDMEYPADLHDILQWCRDQQYAIPIAVEGHPTVDSDGLHIAAFAWDRGEEVWHIFDSLVAGGHMVAKSDELLEGWVNRVFCEENLLYYEVVCE